MIKTDAQLQRCLRYWQRVLRLQDWDVEMKLARHSEMNLQNAAGEISVFAPKRQATSHILVAEDQHLAFGRNHQVDMEYTVVHELLHIHMDKVGPRSRANEAEEQAIHAIASALIAQSRER